jgi:CMP/dCMP kinase
MDSKKIIIAVDGFSSCGKSTLAKSLAKGLHYAYIDSGAMYRAVTLYSLRHGWIENGRPDNEQIINHLQEIRVSFSYDRELGMNTTFLNDENVEEEIRRLVVSENVSPISAIREVRQAMVKLQQAFAARKGIVMDGRDIGTVVFPNAELKIFMTANPEIRAQRRFLELTAKGMKVTLEEVMENIAQRDYIDQHRAESPLRKAGDALLLDNSFLSPDGQLQWALTKVKELLLKDEN